MLPGMSGTIDVASDPVVPALTAPAPVVPDAAAAAAGRAAGAIPGDAAVREACERLIERFSPPLPADEIVRTVLDRYDALRQGARVTAFLPLLAERGAARALARCAAGH